MSSAEDNQEEFNQSIRNLVESAQRCTNRMMEAAVASFHEVDKAMNSFKTITGCHPAQTRNCVLTHNGRRYKFKISIEPEFAEGEEVDDTEEEEDES